MKANRHSPEQIIVKLREADALLATAATIGHVCCMATRCCFDKRLAITFRIRPFSITLATLIPRMWRRGGPPLTVENIAPRRKPGDQQPRMLPRCRQTAVA